MKDVIRHNRCFRLGTVPALVNPREIYSRSRNSACRTGVSSLSSSISPRSAYNRPFGSARQHQSPQRLALAAGAPRAAFVARRKLPRLLRDGGSAAYR